MSALSLLFLLVSVVGLQALLVVTVADRITADTTDSADRKASLGGNVRVA